MTSCEGLKPKTVDDHVTRQDEIFQCKANIVRYYLGDRINVDKTTRDIVLGYVNIELLFSQFGYGYREFNIIINRFNNCQMGSKNKIDDNIVLTCVDQF